MDKTKHEKTMYRVLLGTLAATVLIIAPNTSESTLFKPAVLFLGIGILAAIWLEQTFRNGKPVLSFSSTEIVFVVYVIISACSLFTAMNLRLGMESLVQLVALCIVFIASIRLLAGIENIRQTINIIFLLTAISCAVALLQIHQLLPTITLLASPDRQAISTFGNITYFAGFLVLVLPMVISGIICEKKYSIRQIILLLLTVLIVYVLMETQTRSAWAAAFVSCVLFSLLYFKSKRAKIIGLVSVVIAAGVIALIFSDLIRQRLGGILEMDPTSTVSRRLFFYEGAWQAFLSSPLIGNGIGNFIVFLPKFRSPDYWMFRSEDIVPHAHNEYLEILSETGIIGIAAYALLLLSAFFAFRKILKNSSGNERTIVIGIICGLVAVLIDNIASMNLRTIPVAVSFWILMGMLLSFSSSPKRSLSVSCPSLVQRLWITPYIALALFTVWYVPHNIERYKSEKSFLEGSMQNFNNDRPSASSKFTKALSYNPGHSLARFYLAANHIKSGRYHEARKHLDTLLYEYQYYPKARLMHALCSFELGDTSTASIEIRSAMDLDGSPQTLYIASYFAYRLNKQDEELKTVQILLEKNLKSGINNYAAQGINRLTALCDSQSFHSTYRPLIERLHRQFSDDAPILTAISECYAAFHLKEETRSTVREALALNPADPILIQRLRELEKRLAEGSPPTP